MLNFNIKIDDKDMFKEVAGKYCAVGIGWYPNQMYEETTEPFYSVYAKPNSRSKKYPYGRARRFGKSPARPIASVAAANEYGVPERNVPPRPFMKRTVDGNARKWATYVRNELPKMEPMDLRIMAVRVAGLAINDTKRTIDELMYPPNAPSTIRNKGFNNPLIDTGTMRDTVTWDYEK